MWLQSPTTPHGYCQKQFQHTCSNDECGLVITHEVLRVAKVCRDLVAMDTGQVKFLPGLGLMPTTGELMGEIAGTVSQAILQVFKLAFSQAVAKTSALLPGQVPFTQPNLAKHLFKWSFNEFENYLDANLKHGSVAQLCRGIPIRRIALEMRINKLYAAYHHSGIASLALGPAVMRQATFIGKMKSMGWLQPGRFEGGSRQAFLLQKAAARYHAFLDLMTTMPAGFLCPTLDIDLAWHTHQLKTEQYRLDTSQVTSPNNRFVDHDDKVSEVKLGDAYDFTSRAWLARYRVPYSQCGCHQGDLSAIDGNVVAALPDKLKFWNKGKADSKTEQRRRTVEQVIGEMQQDEKDASHPSVHNLISVEIRTNAAGRNARLNKVKQLDSKAQILAKASPASEKHLELKRALTKDPAHPDPFVQDLPTLTHTLDDTAFAAGLNDHGGESSPKYLPYWGVAVGGGLVVGGPVAWGLAVADPHLLKEEDCTRGACAVGVGAGGGGYCSTGGIRIGSCTGGSGQASGGYVGAGCAAG